MNKSTIQAVQNAIQARASLILVSATGSGKTTTVVKALLKQTPFLSSVVLTPNRHSAAQLAHRHIQPHLHQSAIVATPKQIMKLIENKEIDTSKLQSIFIDEADILLNIQSKYSPINKRIASMLHPPPALQLLSTIIEQRKRSSQLMLNRKKLISPLESSLSIIQSNSQNNHHKKSISSSIKQSAKLAAINAKSNQIRFDPDMAKPLQIIVASATCNSALKNLLINKLKWMQNPVIIDTTHLSRLPTSISHHVYIVDKFGNAHIAVSPNNSEESSQELSDQSKARMTVESVAKKAVDAASISIPPSVTDSSLYSDQVEFDSSFSDPESELESIQSQILPDDHDLIINTLATLIHAYKPTRSIVCVHSDISVQRLVQKLKSLGINADRLYNMTNTSKETTGIEQESTSSEYPKDPSSGSAPSETIPFASYNNGTTLVLCITEHEARGLDLPLTTHVFILGLPSSPSSYIQMAGRTARFGRSGTAITILTGPKQWIKMSNILKSSNACATDPGFTDTDLVIPPS